MNNEQNIAFIGGGNMAAALIGGMRERGVAAERIRVVERDTERGAALAARFEVAVSTEIDDAVRACDVIVLAVKPQQMRTAVAPLAGLSPRQCVMSVAAGVRVADLSRWLGGHAAVVRAMPNTPALVGAGMTGLYAPAAVDATGREAAAAVMLAVGEILWVDNEAAIDAYTAIAGSGPAYVFHFIEALESAAQNMGFDAPSARRLAVGTVHGAARLAATADDAPAVLRERVTSPGGTTAAALEVFAQAEFVEIVARAANAARARAMELGEELGRGA